MKLVFAARGLPICDYDVVLKRDWQRDERGVMQRDRRRISAFRCSSSRPTSARASASRRRSTRRELRAGHRRSPRSSTARSSSRRRCRTRARSSVAVLGNDDPEASVPGEIIPSREFYDYEAKYIDDGLARRSSPPQLTDAHVAEVRALAIAAFKAIDGAGMARVDFLLAGDTGVLYLNEAEHHSRVHHDQHVLEDVGRDAAWRIRRCSIGSSRSRSNGTPRNSSYVPACDAYHPSPPGSASSGDFHIRHGFGGPVSRAPRAAGALVERLRAAPAARFDAASDCSHPLRRHPGRRVGSLRECGADRRARARRGLRHDPRRAVRRRRRAAGAHLPAGAGRGLHVAARRGRCGGRSS